MMHRELRTGSNCIVTAWAGTGLHPYNRASPYWEASIAKWGRRVELAHVPVRDTNGAMILAPSLAATFAAMNAEPGAPAISLGITTITLMGPAARAAQEASRARTFGTRLGAMISGESIELRGKGTERSAPTVASLVSRGSSYLLIYADVDVGLEVISLEEVQALAERFELPAASKRELSVSDAQRLRLREGRVAAAAREAEKKAAVAAVTELWNTQQARISPTTHQLHTCTNNTHQLRRSWQTS